jgi:hypothetical protein
MLFGMKAFDLGLRHSYDKAGSQRNSIVLLQTIHSLLRRPVQRPTTRFQQSSKSTLLLVRAFRVEARRRTDSSTLSSQLWGLVEDGGGCFFFVLKETVRGGREAEE